MKAQTDKQMVRCPRLHTPIIPATFQLLMHYPLLLDYLPIAVTQVRHAISPHGVTVLDGSLSLEWDIGQQSTKHWNLGAPLKC
jgi:hypothetical protein